MTATGSALRGPVLWRLHVPPAKAPDILAKLEPLGAQWTLDWGGGLIWLALDGEVDTIRAAAETAGGQRTEEHTSELQSLMRISYAVFCLKKTIKIRIQKKQ